MRLPLHIKLMVSYLAVVGLVLLPTLFYLRVTLREATIHRVQRELRADTATVRDRLAAATPAQFDGVVALLAAALPQRFTVVDPAGRVLADSQAPARALESHAGRPEIRDALARGEGHALRRSATRREPLLYVAMRFPAAGAPRGVVRLARPLREIDAASAQTLAFMNKAAAVALSFAVFLSLVAAMAASRPLRRIAVAARAFAAGDFGHPVAVTSGDEIGEVARALADLGDRLRDKLLASGADRATLQALLDDLPVGVIVYDPERQPVAVNGAARRLVDLPPDREHERGAQVARLDTQVPAIEQCLDRGASDDVPLRLPWRPGATLAARWIAGFAPDGARQPVLVVLDRAPEERAADLARALASVTARLRALAAALPDREAAEALRAADDAERLRPTVPAAPGDVAVARLEALCDEALAAVAPRARAGGVRVELRVTDPAPPVAEAGGRAALALRWMLGRAVDAAAPGSTLVLAAEPREAVVRLSVRGAAAAVDGDVARLAQSLGGDAGSAREGEVTESWLAIPRA